MIKDILTIICSLVVVASFRENGWPYIWLFGLLWLAMNVMPKSEAFFSKWYRVLIFPLVHVAQVGVILCLLAFALVDKKMFIAYILIISAGLLISKLRKGREEVKGQMGSIL